MFKPVAIALSVITGVSCVQISLFPRLPHADEPGVNPAFIPDFQIDPIGVSPGKSNLNWAFSSIRHYSLRPRKANAHYPSFQLSVTGLTVRREENLQVALVTRGNPSLEMVDRTLFMSEGDEYALGTIGGVDAIQSCIVPDGHSGVRQEALARSVSHQSLIFQDLSGVLKRILGLESTGANTCILMTLQSPQQGHIDELRQTWHTLRMNSRSY
jgi:hypothetical protein